MSNIDKQALREAASRLGSSGNETHTLLPQARANRAILWPP